MSDRLIPSHAKDRFFQRYGAELTQEIMVELIGLVPGSTARERDAFLPGRERVWINWRGHSVGIVWSSRERFIVTFLPATVHPGQGFRKRGKR